MTFDKKRTEKDDFWDLSDLVPKRKPSPILPTSRSTDAVEIALPSAPVNDAVAADVPLTERFVSPHAANEQQYAPKPEKVYRPKGALIREVRIYPWKNEYTYYEQFRRHAEQLCDREGSPAAEVDFFSYMPQYTQLNRSQLDYYFWWRTNFRQGVCLPAAYSYLLLYLYELINLGEKHQNPQTGQENMLRLWLSYREKHPRLDVLVREWLCDYSLLHQLPAPHLESADYRHLLSGCRLKEFYVSAAEGADEMTAAVLLFCNNYDYTKSKFYRPDTKEDYDRVLGGAIREALTFLQEQSGNALTDASGISTLGRDTFSGAVCSWRLKRRIEVDYTSFSHTHELRYIMTDVLKYAENALRARNGVKSRLSIYAISIPLRERLDAYLATVLPPKVAHTTAKKADLIPLYERRYDLPQSELSPERAAAIESESWETTQRLVEAFSDPEREENSITVREKCDKTPVFAADAPPVAFEQTLPPIPNGSPLQQALGDLAAFLPLAAAGDRLAQRAFARETGRMLDALADEINTVAGDVLGDIILEDAGGVYTLIEDYIETLTQQGVL